mmetsp:Transcript_12574/g.53877  ORF Transcript_12574/g.53877 Transcript_12574/m.53877 type:complete len:218 (+) Transcript_12574:1378-2031(+)
MHPGAAPAAGVGGEAQRSARSAVRAGRAGRARASPAPGGVARGDVGARRQGRRRARRRRRGSASGGEAFADARRLPPSARGFVGLARQTRRPGPPDEPLERACDAPGERSVRVAGDALDPAQRPRVDAAGRRAVALPVRRAPDRVRAPGGVADARAAHARRRPFRSRLGGRCGGDGDARLVPGDSAGGGRRDRRRGEFSVARPVPRRLRRRRRRRRG